MELKITKERVLEAAEKCSEAEQVLKNLFPEAFRKEVYIKNGKIEGKPVFGSLIQVRNSLNDKYDNRSIYLDPNFDWVIEKDDGVDVLVPKYKHI